MIHLIKLALLFSVACIATSHSLNNGTTDSMSTQTHSMQDDVPQGNLSTIRTKQNLIIDCNEPTEPQPFASDCQEIFDRGYYFDGVYTIAIGNTVVRVWCDMTDYGWIVIQKRFDGSVDFAKSFDEYKRGFGNLNAEYWLGLETMHQLTSTGSWTVKFDLVDYNGMTAWEEYSDFRIGAGTDFTLEFDKTSFKGTAGDSLFYHHGNKFTTSDMDQDHDDEANCAEKYHGGGGWWHNSCSTVILTGMPYGEWGSIRWKFWDGDKILKSSIMKIKRNN